MFHIGILQLTQNLDDAVRGFKQRLEALNIAVTYEYRNVDGNTAALKQAAEELAALSVDLIFACSTPAALAAKALPGNIPVVFTPVFDPVSAGLVDSFAIPGGKMTGMSGMVPAKDKVTFIKTLLPAAKKIGMLVPAEDQNAQIEAANFRLAAEGSFDLHEIAVKTAADLSLLHELLPEDLDALFLPIGKILEENFSSIAYYTDAMDLPIIASHAPNVSMGALAALCASHTDLGEACAEQAQAVLCEKKAAGTIPVGQPRQEQVLLNAFVADNLGIELPAELTALAAEIYN